jgi:predicted aspartyl protease
LTIPRLLNCQLRCSIGLAALIFVAAPSPGVATAVADGVPSGCTPGVTIVLHATYQSFNEVTISVDAERIEERYSSHGLDYGLVTGSDTQTAWRLDENGVESEDAGDAKRDFMTLRSVLCGDLPPSGTAPGGWPVVVERDPSSGLITSVSYEEHGSPQNIQIEHYGRLTNGAAVPTAWRVNNGQAVVVTEESLARGPVASDRAAWPPMHADVRDSVTPLRASGARFALDGSAGGIPVTCMIDTGATIFAVSSDLANLIDTKDSSQTITYRIGGYGAMQTGRIGSLTVAGSSFTRPVVHVDDHLPPRTVLCGADYLEKVRLRLDFVSHQAKVSIGRPHACASGCVPIDRSGVAHGSATIGGRTLQVLFDSGYAGSIRMPPTTFATINYSNMAGTASYCGSTTFQVEVSFGGEKSVASVCPVTVDSRIPIAVGALAFATYSAVVIDYPDHLLQFTK